MTEEFQTSVQFDTLIPIRSVNLKPVAMECGCILLARPSAGLQACPAHPEAVRDVTIASRARLDAARGVA